MLSEKANESVGDAQETALQGGGKLRVVPIPRETLGTS